jgi:hypothetical protein
MKFEMRLCSNGIIILSKELLIFAKILIHFFILLMNLSSRSELVDKLFHESLQFNNAYFEVLILPSDCMHPPKSLNHHNSS